MNCVKFSASPFLLCPFPLRSFSKATELPQVGCYALKPHSPRRTWRRCFRRNLRATLPAEVVEGFVGAGEVIVLGEGMVSLLKVDHAIRHPSKTRTLARKSGGISPPWLASAQAAGQQRLLIFDNRGVVGIPVLTPWIRQNQAE